MSNNRALKVAVIGAGASGIMSCIKLREAGIEDVTIFEKAEDLGGTWRDNRYPGLACDVPSHLYRYSFEANPEWSHTYSPGAEILAYFRGVAEKYGVTGFIRFGNEVTSAEFSGGKWWIETVKGSQGAFDVVVVATGVLHHPAYPDIPGLESFSGASFHTARWDDSVTLTGKRVGVIGTGSTAAQVVTAVVEEARELRQFQRTAQWVLPLPNPPIPAEERAAYRNAPELMQASYEKLAWEFNNKFAAAMVGANAEVYDRVAKACLENLEQNVADPVLREKLRPDYEVGCKRLVVSDGYYRAISQPNAHLVADRIAGIEPAGVRTADGTLHELDVLVLATGFDTHRSIRPMRVVGEGGRTLDELWADRNYGYLGVAVPGLPNWFMIGGPNSPIGNFSWLLTAERQFGYAMKLIELLHAGRCETLVVRSEAVQAFNDALRRKMPDTIWSSGCSSWYLDKNGDVASWPWTYEKFEADMSEPVLSDYELS